MRTVFPGIMIIAAIISGCGSGGSGSKVESAANPSPNDQQIVTSGPISETGTSGTATPGTTTPETASPETTAPETTTPGTSTPGTTTTPETTTTPQTTTTGPTGPEPTSPESTSPGTTGTGTTTMAQEMVAAINEARSVGKNCGSTYYGAASAVTWNSALTDAAQTHSTDMASNNIFSHTGSDGSSPGDRLTRAGYIWKTYGENIAVGYSTASSVVQAWLGSAGHCRNIMNPAYGEIGAGAAYGAYGGYSSMRYWTLDLGTQRGY